MLPLLFLILQTTTSTTWGYGYDSGTDGACGSRIRTGRARTPPCDLGRQGWCTTAGTAYPWHAVRRFVRENQGLMRRMYGDERHLAVLKAELQTNDIEQVQLRYRDLGDLGGAEFSGKGSRYGKEAPYDDFMNSYAYENELFSHQSRGVDDEDRGEESARLLHKDVNKKNEDVLRTKFVYSDDTVETRRQEFRTMPHFRPTTTPNPLDSNVIVETVVNKSVDSNSAVANVTEEIFYAASVEEVENLTQQGSQSGQTQNGQGATDSTTTATTDNTTTETDTTTAETTVGSTTAEDEAKTPLERETPSTTGAAAASSAAGTGTGAGVEGSTQKTPGANPGMLFQDMEQPEKVQVNYKLRGVNACPVKEEVVAPFWANNTRGEVLALLNLYPFEQYVHWEKCTYEHRQMYCREGCRCEQQYRLHRLLAYDPNNECRGIFSDWFRFPSCCVCICYDMPMEFRVTSRSPRSRDQQTVPDWFKKKNAGGSYNYDN